MKKLFTLLVIMLMTITASAAMNVQVVQSGKNVRVTLPQKTTDYNSWGWAWGEYVGPIPTGLSVCGPDSEELTIKSAFYNYGNPFFYIELDSEPTEAGTYEVTIPASLTSANPGTSLYGTFTVGSSHTHNYEDAWSHDATNHWHACTGTGTCDATKSGEAAHSYGSVVTETAYYTCSVCQYVNETRKAEHDSYLVLDANADNISTLTENYNKKVNVTINNLTIKAGKWSTLCLPFSVPSTQVEAVFCAGTEMAKLSSSSYDATDNKLTLSFTTVYGLGSGKPYLIKVPADVVNPTFNDVNIYNVGGEAITTTYASMKGDFAPKALDGGDQNTWFISNNTFYYPSVDGTLAATKCWFELQGDAQQNPSKSRKMAVRMRVGNEDVTGISTVSAPSADDAAVYNLNGVRVSSPAKKGVYIRNGVKYIK